MQTGAATECMYTIFLRDFSPIIVYSKPMNIICDRILENHPYGCILHIKYLVLKSTLNNLVFLFIYCSSTVEMH